MTTFGLVHGAWHGAWCWELLAGELAERGHRAVAVDLPCDDPAADASAYARRVAHELGDADDVVLVGHSLGGITIPLVAAARPVRRLVFLAALVPLPGRDLQSRFAQEADLFVPGFGAAVERDELRRSFWTDPAAAAADLYGDCPPDLARAAAGRLRPQARAPVEEACPLAALPDVERTAVVCSADRALDPAGCRRAAREILGVEPVELAGSHSPFLARPGELAALLASLV